MPVYSRQQLSGSTNGMPFSSSATQDADKTVIHQVQSTSTNVLECVWLNLQSAKSSGDHMVLITHESATATGIAVRFFVSNFGVATGSIPVFEGLPLTGTDTVLALYAATSGIEHTTITGYINRIATG